MMSMSETLPQPSHVHDTCRQALESVAHVAPSVQTVYCAMYGHQPMTGRQLRDATHLPRRTIYAALQRLKELDVVKERASLRDTRQTYYWVAGVQAETPRSAASA
jgi:DNA-binding transcriptional regulator GbsR (MarR family)